MSPTFRTCTRRQSVRVTAGFIPLPPISGPSSNQGQGKAKDASAAARPEQAIARPMAWPSMLKVPSLSELNVRLPSLPSLSSLPNFNTATGRVTVMNFLISMVFLFQILFSLEASGSDSLSDLSDLAASPYLLGLAAAQTFVRCTTVYVLLQVPVAALSLFDRRVPELRRKVQKGTAEAAVLVRDLEPELATIAKGIAETERSIQGIESEISPALASLKTLSDSLSSHDDVAGPQSDMAALLAAGGFGNRITLMRVLEVLEVYMDKVHLALTQSAVLEEMWDSKSRQLEAEKEGLCSDAKSLEQNALAFADKADALGGLWAVQGYTKELNALSAETLDYSMAIEALADKRGQLRSLLADHRCVMARLSELRFETLMLVARTKQLAGI